MVSWGFAFGRALVIWLWCIVWTIVGITIAVLVTGGSLLSIIANPSGFLANPSPALVGIILGIVIGQLVTTLGILATIVKISVDGALSHHEESGHPQPLPLGTRRVEAKS